MAGYVPEAGDIIWLEFDPQAGLLLCCPMTSQIKGYPFEVKIAGNPASVALADQVKSLDYAVRHARFKGKVSPRELSEIRAKAAALIGKP
jgi:mRNA interferase MazF